MQEQEYYEEYEQNEDNIAEEEHSEGQEDEEDEDDEFGAGSAFQNVGQGLTGRFKNMMMQYWQETINSIEHDDHDFKNHQLPLARIKKVMKTDEEVKMISAEAPILFAKGCDIFITELTMRAWIHAEENKRRTLQRSDIAAALKKSDMFDFLIDIVPRDEEKGKRAKGMQPPPHSALSGSAPIPPNGSHEIEAMDDSSNYQTFLQDYQNDNGGTVPDQSLLDQQFHIQQQRQQQQQQQPPQQPLQQSQSQRAQPEDPTQLQRMYNGF